MRYSISLAMYGINIKFDDSKNEEYFKLDNLPDYNLNSNSFDFLEIMKDILSVYYDDEKCLRNKRVEDNGKSIYLSEFHELQDFDNRGFYGIVEFGNHGNKRKVHDINKIINKSNENFINEDEGVFNPYYFLIVIPKNITRGFLILEQKRGIGIKTMFKSIFLDDGLKKFPKYAHYKIDLPRIFPKELKENFYKKGELLSFKLIKNQIPDDITEDLKTEIKTIETEIKLNGDKTTPEEFLNLREDNLLSFQSVEYDLIKVTSKYNGKPKTFILTDPTTIIPYINITDEIHEWEDGNPKLDSIHKVALEHLFNNYGKIFDKYR